MSSYSFEMLLPEEPILIGTIYDSFSLKEDIEPFLNQLALILVEQDQQIYYINNILDLKVKVFQDFLVATSKTFQGEGAMILNYPYLNTIIVSTDPLIQLAVKGFNTEAFGFMDFPIFDTVEEALAYARATIQEKTSEG